jgi:hypothetical protein
MKPIMLLIDELNSICVMDQSKIDDSSKKLRIRQIFAEFVKQDYKIVKPRFEPGSEEYNRLSDNGKLLCQQMLLVRCKKQEAIVNSQFEFAANLRDWERDLKRAIINDFSKGITARIFVLKSDELKEIIYNDHKGKFKEIFKTA